MIEQPILKENKEQDIVRINLNIPTEQRKKWKIETQARDFKDMSEMIRYAVENMFIQKPRDLV